MAEAGSRQRVFVIGTRAQLIKVAPVVVTCERLGLATTLLMTGQHHETMQDLIGEFGITSPQVQALLPFEHATVRSLLRWLPAAYIGIVARLRELDASGEGLDVLVHGDTLSTLVGAIAGRRCGARVVHLESGLSSGRLFDPFPEELCRRSVFRITNLAMCPNPQAVAYMRRHHRCRVVDTGGNTIIDAVTLSGASPLKRDPARPYLVASLHRFQNLYDAPRLVALVELIEAIAARYPVHFVLHPATRNRLGKQGLLRRLETAAGVQLSPRLGYRDFLRLAAAAACVLTDGGSNQEELAALGVPTIVMRERTERPDGLGANALMEGDVVGGVRRFVLEEGFEQLRRAPAAAPEEGPSQRIARALVDEELLSRRDISR
jgi:UDP-N-acetylglucosamine 2-epimerase (non-hydrolysing)